MFKFLRKYNKFLLAVFGVLLMITFLIPQAIDQFSRQSGAGTATVATIGDGKIINGVQWERAQRELQFLQRNSTMFSQMSVEHWYLLALEAEQAGFVSTGPASGMTDELVTQMAMMSGVRDANFIRQTMAKAVGVEQLTNLYRAGGLFSDQRLKRTAERLLHQAVIQYFVIKADDNSDVAPSDEQIASHFAKYSESLAGSGDDGFGYKFPDRVKLEWLAISNDAVKAAVEKSEAFGGVQQRMHWRKFESDPAKGFPPRPTEGTAEVPDIVRNDLLQQLTQEKVDEIAKFAADQLRFNRRGIPEREGYVVLPDDWSQRKMKFTDLAGEIQSQFQIELPAYESKGDEWIAVNDLGMLLGIGLATTNQVGSTTMTLAQLASQAKEFPRETPHTIFIQKDIAGPALKGTDGSLYLFRIVDADPSRVPTSVDEVRDAVVSDLKRINRFQALAASLPQIEQEARERGMLAAALERGVELQRTSTISLANRFQLMQFAQFRMPVSVNPTSLTDIGVHRETVETIVDRALALPRTADIGALPDEQRIFGVPVEDRQAVIVVRLMHQNPLTQEDYASMVQSGAIQQLMASEESQELDPFSGAFSADALVQRHNFKFTREAEGDVPAPDAAASAGN